MAGGKTEIDEKNDETDTSKMDAQQLKFYLDELNEQMDLAAKNLEFEVAARIRDRILEINKIKRLKGLK